MRLSASCKLGTALFVLALLAACGGGGGSNGGTGTATSTASTTTTTVPATAANLPGGSSIAGVVATGSPLLGANVRMVDATGAAVSFIDGSGNTVSSGKTSNSDGTYRVTLASPGARLPLLIEVAGQDAAGTPVVIHSRLDSTTIPLVANVTPVTDAVVALLLGVKPTTVFQNAASNAAAIATLGNRSAVTASSDLVKTIIATNLTDGKITDSKKLDLFQDSSFSPNKTGLDAAIEGLKIQIAKDANGNEQLQLSNKFLQAGTIEVKLDLATAKNELAKTSGGSVAKAIVSTAKTTTSPTTTLAILPLLDNLNIAINRIISAGDDFVDLNRCKYPLLAQAAYNHNAFRLLHLSETLNSYAQRNVQFNKFQMTGCADDPVTTKTCSRVLVSSIITDVGGNIVDVFSDAVQYNKATSFSCEAAPTVNVPQLDWTFVGNNLLSDFHIYPAAYTTFGFDGSAATATASNTGSGVQVAIFSVPGSDPQDGNDRIITMPSGHIIRFTRCGFSYLCLNTAPISPTAVEMSGTGELSDSLLEKTTFGWMGSLDTTMGAKYSLTVNESITDATLPVTAYLSSDVPTDLSNEPFPKLDGISGANPLTVEKIITGPTLSWANWANTNLDMKIILVRAILTSATSPALIRDATLPITKTTTATIPAFAVSQDFVPLSYQIWLGAQDSLGRRYYSKYTSAP